MTRTQHRHRTRWTERTKIEWGQIMEVFICSCGARRSNIHTADGYVVRSEWIEPSKWERSAAAALVKEERSKKPEAQR